MEVRRLSPKDDRAPFRSGNDDLDRFLHRFAGQNQFRHHIGVTYVAVEGQRILGFVTVAPAHLEVDAMPAVERKKLPTYPLPILRLARLGVDASVQGQGLGKVLLRFALQLALTMADEVGCAGVVVDAKPEAVAFYERYGFRALDALEGASEVRPRPVPMFLAIRAVKAALA